ncbi:MAG: hypothetical protein QM729_17580 [Solirubrobacterales bacterium]
MPTETPIFGALSRRDLLDKSARAALSLGVLGSFGVLAGCGSDSSTGSTAATSAGTTAAGTSIPKTTVNFTVAPAADDGLAVIGMYDHYFDDVGITIGPSATGANYILGESLAPLLNGQVETGSLVYEVLLQQLDTVKNVRPYLIIDTYVGHGFFAPADAQVKDLTEFAKTAATYEQAAKETLAQMQGKRIAVASDVVNQPYWNSLFEIGGVDPSDAERLENTNILELLQAGKLDFGGIANGPQYVAALEAGLKPVFLQKDQLELAEDQAALALYVNHDSLVTTEDFYDENYDTVLRISSVMYRILNDLLGAGEKKRMEALETQLPWLDAKTGTKLTPKALGTQFENLALIRDLDQQKAFFEGQSVDNIYYSGELILKHLKKTGVLHEDHTVAEVDGAKKVWTDLMKYRAESEELLEKLGKGSTNSQKQVISAAQKQYDNFNYLDASRFLRSADS